MSGASGVLRVSIGSVAENTSGRARARTTLHPSDRQASERAVERKGARPAAVGNLGHADDSGPPRPTVRLVTGPYDAILLVSFGGPEGPDDVMPFLENVTAGRNIPRERLAVVAEQYEHFGGVSPLNDQCRRQRAALEAELAERGVDLPVYWGNRNWAPFLTDTVRTMTDDGVRRALAVFTSAYSSYSGCRQYRENIQAACDAVPGAPRIDKVRAFYDHPGFIEPFIGATAEAIATHGAGARPTLVFTAHSIPNSMAATCDYEAQLREACRLVAAGVGDDLDWCLAWQSRSGPPQIPWLEPDVNDEIERLAGEGGDAVVIVPIGFVSDHMEVGWDLDIQAAETAAEQGVRLTRAVSPGTAPDPAFISMWAELIEERIAVESDPDRADRALRRALGGLEVRPDVCPGDCCPAPSRGGH